MYKPHEIESKWQKYWTDAKLYQATEDKSKTKKYILDMFPYPSGDGLHVGHPRVYVASDVVARKARMDGANVLHPMGWDAFGLPAENYALKHGVHPKISTAKNIANFRRQFDMLGFSYDWSREVNTTDPKYYKWTQWIFLQMFKKGLAYQANMAINWCPKDKIGLANEEVVNGKCDLCGTPVERRQISQWMLKITAYADRLLKDLEGLDWPESIKTMQHNWIGRSEGASVKYKLDLTDELDSFIEVFTTRPDTLFGATYMVLAPEHPLVGQITTEDKKADVEAYIKESAKKSDLERTELQKTKTGVFTGAYAINPVNGQKIPVWIADYVLASYGTGAIMAVPAHDERDFEFAKNYHLLVIPVISAPETNWSNETNWTNWSNENGAYTGDGVLVNSASYNGLTVAEAKKAIVEDLEKKGLAKFEVNYRLRDWVFSRQHYWGEPIPIIHCPKCGTVSVPDDELPVLLPEVERYEPSGTGESPLATMSDWVNTTCPSCGGSAKRETDTMPQWAGSSWYWLRFTDAHNDDALASKDALKYWTPVDTYVGGAEHAVLHLLYARFWNKFLFDIGVVPTTEPFMKLKSVGLILANAYKDSAGRWVHYDDIVFDGDTAFHKTTGEILQPEIEKMSKSKGNVINPDFVVEKYGADSLRVYTMFLGAWNEMSLFNLSSIEGSSRFLKKVYLLIDKAYRNVIPANARIYPDGSLSHPSHMATEWRSKSGMTAERSNAIKRLAAKTILKVTDDIENFRFNTAISQLMIYNNALSELKEVSKEDLEILTQLLAPFAPYLAEELWEKLGHKPSIFQTNWPRADQKDAADEEVEIVIQINGRVRSRLTVPAGLSKEELIEKAKTDPSAQKYLTAPIKQSIVVPDKLVNFVL